MSDPIGGEPLSEERLRTLAQDGMDVGRPSALVRELASALLASQESCRSLSEALERIANEGGHANLSRYIAREALDRRGKV